MATSPAWAGPRPPRFLIWDEDIPPRPEALPRPIPPDVLDQLDPLLEQATKTMKEGQEPPILAPVFWDALLILRHTGMRFEHLAHLKAPDDRGKAARLPALATACICPCMMDVQTRRIAPPVPSCAPTSDICRSGRAKRRTYSLRWRRYEPILPTREHDRNTSRNWLTPKR